MSKSRQEEIDAVVQRINSQSKRRVIGRAGDLAIPYHRRRPTGLMSVDLGLGGGWPAGTANHISGPENAGKTRLLYKTYAMHQRLYGDRARILHVQIEGAVDLFFMRKQGVQVALPKPLIDQMDNEREKRGLPRFTKEERRELMREVGQVLFAVPATMEEFLETALETVEANGVHLIGADSIAAAVPSAEAELAMEDFAPRGIHATLMKRFYQHFFPLVGGLNGLNETTLVFLNQVIANSAKAAAPGPMQKYLKDWTPAGAFAGKHGKSIDLLIWSGPKVREKGDKGRVIGKEMKWEVQKGKMGTHDNISGECRTLYDEDPWEENARDLLMTGLAEGVITDGKPMILRTATENYTLPPHDELIEKICTELDTEMLIRRAILEKRGMSCDYGWEG